VATASIQVFKSRRPESTPAEVQPAVVFHVVALTTFALPGTSIPGGRPVLVRYPSECGWLRRYAGMSARRVTWRPSLSTQSVWISCVAVLPVVLSIIKPRR